MSAQTATRGATHQITSNTSNECGLASHTNQGRVCWFPPKVRDEDASVASFKQQLMEHTLYLQRQASMRVPRSDSPTEWRLYDKPESRDGLSPGATVWPDDLLDPAYAEWKFSNNASSVRDSHVEDSRPSGFAESWPDRESHDAKLRRRMAKIYKDLAEGRYDVNGRRIRKSKARATKKPKRRLKKGQCYYRRHAGSQELVPRLSESGEEFSGPEEDDEDLCSDQPQVDSPQRVVHGEKPEVTNAENGAELEEELDDMTTEEPVLLDEVPRFRAVNY
ncbi:hypothetical protein H2201_006159 [Coniosporium apollinis]|uniref:Rrn9 domain-containing protein n=1 Tax=Coniosporium apollinis TaxID=61459 RepID=A0ABQ9NN02_9PEZI|nr:hypothetical protein H2201_006159 [Coniosporium apollinis]